MNEQQRKELRIIKKLSSSDSADYLLRKYSFDNIEWGEVFIV